MKLPAWLRPDPRTLKVERLRALVGWNDQRRPNGTLYKRFWSLQFSTFFNKHVWTLNSTKYPREDEEVLAFAEVGVEGR